MSKANQRAKKEKKNQIKMVLWALNEQCKAAIEGDDPEYSLTDPHGAELKSIASRVDQIYNDFKSGKEPTNDDLTFVVKLPRHG